MEKDKETKATEEREGSQVNQNVVDFGSAMTKTTHGTVYTLAIIGQIEGHTAAPNGTKTTQYEHMLPLLAKLEESREVDAGIPPWQERTASVNDYFCSIHLYREPLLR